MAKLLSQVDKYILAKEDIVSKKGIVGGRNGRKYYSCKKKDMTGRKRSQEKKAACGLKVYLKSFMSYIPLGASRI